MDAKNFFLFVILITISICLFTLIPLNDGNLERIVLKKPRIYKSMQSFESEESGFSLKNLGLLAIGGVAAAGLTSIIAPVALTYTGFTAAGITGNSVAALWQSYIGNVASGTLFSALQSAGMAGVSYSVLTTIAGISASTIGVIIVRGEKLTIDVQTLETMFDFHDIDGVDSILNSQLKKILDELHLNLNDLNFRYRKATGRQYTNIGKINYGEYLKLFDIKLYEGEELRTMLSRVYEEKWKEKRNLYYEDFKKLLPGLKVKASDEKVKKAYNYVTKGEMHEPISFRQFLQIFGF